MIPRKDRVWTIEGTAKRMILALERAERDVPVWLRLVSDREPVEAANQGETDRPLENSSMKHLPLTDAQAAEVSARLAAGRDATAVLSPRQRALLARIDARLADDAAALESYRPPTDPIELAAYQDRLLGALDR